MITDPAYVCPDWMRGVPGGIVRDACGMHYAICDATRGGCGASSGWGETLDEVADKWNARAVTPAAARESGHVYD